MSLRNGLLIAAGLFLTWAGTVAAQPSPLASVDPFIGTQDMGHCYPGATVPFGFVQLSPDTDTADYSLDGRTYNPDVYRYCAGYQYGDSTIVGFSHTHFHGTGHADLGDVLLVPQVGPVARLLQAWNGLCAHDWEPASGTDGGLILKRWWDGTGMWRFGEVSYLELLPDAEPALRRRAATDPNFPARLTKADQ